MKRKLLVTTGDVRPFKQPRRTVFASNPSIDARALAASCVPASEFSELEPGTEFSEIDPAFLPAWLPGDVVDSHGDAALLTAAIAADTPHAIPRAAPDSRACGIAGSGTAGGGSTPSSSPFTSLTNVSCAAEASGLAPQRIKTPCAASCSPLAVHAASADAALSSASTSTKPLEGKSAAGTTLTSCFSSTDTSKVSASKAVGRMVDMVKHSPFPNPLLRPFRPPSEQQEMLASWGLPSCFVSAFETLGVQTLHAWQSCCLATPRIMLDCEGPSLSASPPATFVSLALCGSGGESTRSSFAASELLSTPRSLVYTAPTSGGKTLVGDVLLLKRLLLEPAPVHTHSGATAVSVGTHSAPTPTAPRRIGIVALPLRGMVQQRVQHYVKLLAAAGYNAGPGSPSCRVVGTAGAPGAGASILIATYERACNILNQLVAQGAAHELRVVVVDELHMLGDEGRGAVVEALLSKVRWLQTCYKRPGGGSGGGCSVQVVGMSATLPNPARVAQWLDAACFQDLGFRPIPLSHSIVLDKSVYAKLSGGERRAGATNNDWKAAFAPPIPLPPRKEPTPEEICAENNARLTVTGEKPVVPDHRGLTAVVAHTVAAGGQVLVFCPTKDSVEVTARMLVQHMGTELRLVQLPRGGRQWAPTLADRADRDARLRALELQGGAAALVKCCAAGIGFHHAGLHAHERLVVEEAYTARSLRVVVCTSTLAVGVNLPAARVILLAPFIGSRFIDCSSFIQMSGRAGRVGMGVARGESVVFAASEKEAARVLALMEATPPQVQSRLLHVGCLELVAAARHAGGSCVSASSTSLEREVRARHLEVLDGPLGRYLVDMLSFKYLESEGECQAAARLLFASQCAVCEGECGPDCMGTGMPTLVGAVLAGCRVRDYTKAASASASAASTAGSDTLLLPTDLGRAVAASSLSPAFAEKFYALLHSQESLITGTSLHVLALIVPFSPPDLPKIAWRWLPKMLALVRLRDPLANAVFDAIGLENHFVDAACDHDGPNSIPGHRYLSIATPTSPSRWWPVDPAVVLHHHRIWSTLLLYCWLYRIPFPGEFPKHIASSSTMNAFAERTGALASRVAAFAAELRWWTLSKLLHAVRGMCVRRAPARSALAQIKGVLPAYVDEFKQHGLKSAAQVRSAGRPEVFRLIKLAAPFALYPTAAAPAVPVVTTGMPPGLVLTSLWSGTRPYHCDAGAAADAISHAAGDLSACEPRAEGGADAGARALAQSTRHIDETHQASKDAADEASRAAVEHARQPVAAGTDVHSLQLVHEFRPVATDLLSQSSSDTTDSDSSDEDDDMQSWHEWSDADNEEGEKVEAGWGRSDS